MTAEPNMDVRTAFRREHFRRLPIDGQALKNMAEAGLTWLRTNHKEVNALNVFPVPDGDTGTNMVLTMQAAYDEIADSAENNLGKMAHEVAQGALMGARGNSGVILSQLWRGFARTLDHQGEVDAATLVEAFAEARDTAYRGVVRPVEGTILTVAKDMAEAAEKAYQESDDPLFIFEEVVEAAERSVERTPELLPVLKEAGVVDAGGKGLYYVLEGMLRYINGQSLEGTEAVVQPLGALQLEESLDSVEPGQDFEVIVDFHPDQPLNIEAFYRNLEEMGTSIQVGEGDGVYRVHIHVPEERRYEPIDYTMRLGTITKVAMENLRAQMEALGESDPHRIQLTPLEAGQVATVVVAPGPGIARVFTSLGVSAIVEGGQTMNPSTQEIIASFENLPTDRVIILPNNKNIILAAEAAAELTVKTVAVVPTLSVPQGLAAMLVYDPDREMDGLVEGMTAAMADVETGEITTAVRSVEVDGVDVAEGQTIVLHNGRLLAATKDLPSACMRFLEAAGAAEKELITLFYGEDLAPGQVNRIADAIRSRYPEQEVEVQDGGQPHYQFILSVE